MTPSFLRDLEDEASLNRIAWGVPTGYGFTAILVVFAIFFDRLGLLPNTHVLVFYLAPVKIITNTAMWWALKKRVAVLPIAGLNQLADVVLLTAVLYYTGGPASPLTSLYFVVVAIVAMLTNIGATVTTAVLMIVSYAIMVALMSAGVLKLHAPFLQTVYTGQGVTWELVVIDTFKLLVLLGMMVMALFSVLRMVRRREEELEVSNARLRDANRAKSQFIANVTHELRTPIHGVLGLSEMLGDGIYGDMNAKQQTALQNIDRSAQNLLHMVDDLLSLERVDTGRISVQFKYVEPAQIVDDVTSAIEWMRGTKDVTIESSVAEGVPRFLSDPGVLVHVLNNLMSNALKFTPEGGRVDLRVFTERSDIDRVVFEIEDTGIGIPAEHLERIFRAFEQVDGTAQRQYGGAGLGLSVVMSLSVLISAEIDVDSEPGKRNNFSSVSARRADTSFKRRRRSVTCGGETSVVVPCPA